MSKIHIVSNRLPLSISKSDDKIELTPSVGGLATGMRSIYREFGGKWIGWSGMNSDELTSKEKDKIDVELQKESCLAVHLHA